MLLSGGARLIGMHERSSIAEAPEFDEASSVTDEEHSGPMHDRIPQVPPPDL